MKKPTVRPVAEMTVCRLHRAGLSAGVVTVEAARADCEVCVEAAARVRSMSSGRPRRIAKERKEEETNGAQRGSAVPGHEEERDASAPTLPSAPSAPALRPGEGDTGPVALLDSPVPDRVERPVAADSISPQRTARRKSLVVAGIGLVGTAALFVGIFWGNGRPPVEPPVMRPVTPPALAAAPANQADCCEARAQLENKVMAVVAERNPEAKVKEFEGFARVLLEESEKAGIDPTLVMAVIDKESQFRADAVGGVGEIGLMQIRPSTAELITSRLGLPYEPPVKGKDGKYVTLGSLGIAKYNVKIGIIHLRDLTKQYGMTAVALRAYNRGVGYAKEHRPADRYSEDVGHRVIALLGWQKDGKK